MAEDWFAEIGEDEPRFEHFRLAVDSGQEPMRVDKYMSTHLEKTSRNRIQCAIKEGYVKVGEKTVKANYVVRPGDVIRFVMPYERRGVEVIPQDIPLDIVYEDDDVLVIDITTPLWSTPWPTIFIFLRVRTTKGWGCWCTG